MRCANWPFSIDGSTSAALSSSVSADPRECAPIASRISCDFERPVNLASFAKVAPIAPQAAALFYGRLFEIAPEVRPVFKGDIEEQGRTLVAVLHDREENMQVAQPDAPSNTAVPIGHCGH